MKRIYYIIFLVSSISSCQEKHNFWSIEQFNIVESGLNDNEPVRVLYYSKGPYNDQVDKGFYRHAVIISSVTKDTFNVLTFPDPDLDNLTTADNVLVYNDHPIVRKAITNMDALSEEMKRTIENIDTTKMRWPKYTLVYRDHNYDYIADNQYKSVIGSLTKK